MKQDEAERLVAKLFAAYPYHKGELKAAIYVERMARLDFGAAREAVEGLIDNARDLPLVSELLDGYRAVCERKRMGRLALEEASVSAEERAETVARMVALTEAMHEAQELHRQGKDASVDDLWREKVSARLSEGGRA